MTKVSFLFSKLTSFIVSSFSAGRVFFSSFSLILVFLENPSKISLKFSFLWFFVLSFISTSSLFSFLDLSSFLMRVSKFCKVLESKEFASFVFLGTLLFVCKFLSKFFSMWASLLFKISLKTLSIAPLKNSFLSKFGKVAFKSSSLSTLISLTSSPISLAKSKSSPRLLAFLRALRLFSFLMSCKSALLLLLARLANFTFDISVFNLSRTDKICIKEADSKMLILSPSSKLPTCSLLITSPTTSASLIFIC